MCKRSLDLHRNLNKVVKTTAKIRAVKKKQAKPSKVKKPNLAELFFLLNEDVLN